MTKAVKTELQVMQSNVLTQKKEISAHTIAFSVLGLLTIIAFIVG